MGFAVAAANAHDERTDYHIYYILAIIAWIAWKMAGRVSATEMRSYNVRWWR